MKRILITLFIISTALQAHGPDLFSQIWLFLTKHAHTITSRSTLDRVLERLDEEILAHASEQDTEEALAKLRDWHALVPWKVLQDTINPDALDMYRDTGFIVYGSGTTLAWRDQNGIGVTTADTGLPVSGLAINQTNGNVAMTSTTANRVKIYSPQAVQLYSIGTCFSHLLPPIAYSGYMATETVVVADNQNDFNAVIEIIQPNGFLLNQFPAEFIPTALVKDPTKNLIVYSSGYNANSKDGEIKTSSYEGITGMDIPTEVFAQTGLTTTYAPDQVIQSSFKGIMAVDMKGELLWLVNAPHKSRHLGVATYLGYKRMVAVAQDNDNPNQLTITQLNYAGKEEHTLHDTAQNPPLRRATWAKPLVNPGSGTVVVGFDNQLRYYITSSTTAQAALLHCLAALNRLDSYSEILQKEH